MYWIIFQMSISVRHCVIGWVQSQESQINTNISFSSAVQVHTIRFKADTAGLVLSLDQTSVLPVLSVQCESSIPLLLCRSQLSQSSQFLDGVDVRLSRGFSLDTAAWRDLQIAFSKAEFQTCTCRRIEHCRCGWVKSKVVWWERQINMFRSRNLYQVTTKNTIWVTLITVNRDKVIKVNSRPKGLRTLSQNLRTTKLLSLLTLFRNSGNGKNNNFFNNLWRHQYTADVTHLDINKAVQLVCFLSLL